MRTKQWAGIVAKRLVWLWRRIPRMPRNRRGALIAVYRFWTERFTPAGKTAAALWLFLLFLESLPGLSGLWPLLAVFSASFVVAWLGSWKTPPGHVVLNSPPRVLCGDWAPIEGTPQGNFVHSHLLLFTLQDALKSKESNTAHPWQVALLAREPGVFPISTATLLRTEPLGLMRSRRICPQNISFMVHPRPAQIASMDFLTHGASGQAFLQQMQGQSTQGHDFAGVRPYRPGDSWRDLHHLAWARHGQPVSREYAPESGGGITLALESWRNRRGESYYWPYTLRLGAGMALWLAERRLLGGIVLNGTHASLSKHPTRTEILDILSTIPRQKQPALLPIVNTPLLIIGCSHTVYSESLLNKPLAGFKRIGVGSPFQSQPPNSDSHLWLNGHMVESLLRQGKGIPL